MEDHYESGLGEQLLKDTCLAIDPHYWMGNDDVLRRD
jgi:hypothetical protein